MEQRGADSPTGRWGWGWWRPVVEEVTPAGRQDSPAPPQRGGVRTEPTPSPAPGADHERATLRTGIGDVVGVINVTDPIRLPGLSPGLDAAGQAPPAQLPQRRSRPRVIAVICALMVGVTVPVVAGTIRGRGLGPVNGVIATQSADPAPRSSSGTPGRSDDGMLLPADLTPGRWEQLSDPAPSIVTSRALRPPCATTGGTAGRVGQGGATGTDPPRGSTVAHSYRASDPRSPGVTLTVTESSSYLTDHQVTRFAKELIAASRCQLQPTGPNDADGRPTAAILLASNEAIVVVGSLTATKQVGSATANVLAGRSWIRLDARATRGDTVQPLPGQTAWLIGVAVDAAERANAVRPKAPVPNIAAGVAAMAGATAGVVASASARPTGGADPIGPGAAATGTPATGYLSVSDLGSRGGWPPAPARSRRSGRRNGWTTT